MASEYDIPDHWQRVNKKRKKMLRNANGTDDAEELSVPVTKAAIQNQLSNTKSAPTRYLDGGDERSGVLRLSEYLSDPPEPNTVSGPRNRHLLPSRLQFLLPEDSRPSKKRTTTSTRNGQRRTKPGGRTVSCARSPCSCSWLS